MIKAWKLSGILCTLISPPVFSHTPQLNEGQEILIDGRASIIGNLKRGEYITASSGTKSKQNLKLPLMDKLDLTNRYLVELIDLPTLSYRTELKKKSHFLGQNITVHNKSTKEKIVNEETETYFQFLTKKQFYLVNQIKQINSNIEIVKQFNKVTNLIVVEANISNVDAIKRLPGVKRVVREQRYQVNLTESVPLINAQNVWSLTDDNELAVQGEGVDVAILDTGIDYTHPSLGGCFGAECRVVAGYDFVNQDNDPMDGHGHGTHVAGIVGANGESIKGVAPNVNLHAYKVLNDNGSGFSTDIIAAIEKAVDPDGDPLTDDALDIINMSLGGSGSSLDPLAVAVNNAVDAGVIVVVSAGNNGGYGDINKSSPASAANAITVGSSTKLDELSSFSSKAEPTEYYPNKPEIIAPGSNINSTHIGSSEGSPSYKVLSGTSMAAPHVAGAVALLKQLNPEITPQLAKELLIAGAVGLDLDPLSQGAGRIDIEKSMNATISTEQGFINLGQVDKTLDFWQNQKVLTIKNNSDLEQTYQLDLPDNFPSQAELTINTTEIVVAANSSEDILVTVIIDEVSSFPFPENNAGIYYGNLIISSTTDSLNVPITLDHSFTLSISTNSLRESNVFIGSEDGTFFRAKSIRSIQPTEIRIPNKRLAVIAFYNYLRAEDLVNVDIPAGLTAHGYETFTIEPNGDVELSLNIENLVFKSGINSVKGLDGEGISRASVSGKANHIRIDLDDTFLQSWTGGDDIGYTVFGNIASDSKIKFDTLYYVADEFNNDLEAHWYYLWHNFETTGMQNVNFDLELANDLKFEVVLDSELYSGSNQHYTINSALGGVSTFQRTINTDIDKVIVHSLDVDYPNFAYTEVIQMEEKENLFWPAPLAATSEIRFNQSNSLEKSFLRGSSDFITATNSLSLAPQATFWSVSVNVNHSDILIADFDYSTFYFSLLNDNMANTFTDLNSQYEWYCDGTVVNMASINLSSGSNYKYISRPYDQNCTDLKVVFSYDSYLDGIKYLSKSVYDANDSSSYPEISSIRLWKNNIVAEDQALNKINSKIVIETNSQHYQSQTVEKRINDGEWQLLNIDSTTPLLTIINIPLIEGSHTADLRVSYVNNSNKAVVHTLNGFFKYGTESGGDADSDDDGVYNQEDPDDDNDGINDLDDAFPYDPNESIDTDNDGIGNNADTDDDGDGVADNDDAFPLDDSESVDTDNDGIGNNADTDDDGDGVADNEDAFPLDDSESVDTDNDGIGNNADMDDDGDGVADSEDAFPLDESESVDTDNDGIGNNADTDDDGDGVDDSSDAYPLDPTRTIAPTPEPTKSGGGGGSNILLFLLILLITMVRRKNKTY